MIILGIDPGKKGGISWINRTEASAIAMPLAGKELDLPYLADLVKGICPDKVVIEKQGAMPGQGVVSMFTIGKNYGLLLGICAQYSVEIVTPQRWKKEVLQGTTKDKNAAIAYCRQSFPDVSLLPNPKCRKPSDGIADALCIAEYGRRAFSAGSLAA